MGFLTFYGSILILISIITIGYNSYQIYKKSKAKVEQKQKPKMYNHLDILHSKPLKPWLPKQVEIDWDKAPSAVDVALGDQPKFPDFQPSKTAVNICLNCGKATNDGTNYCEYDCMVNYAIKMGGKTIAPNHLQITCIDKDFTMLEHAHVNHPNYMFPIYVECIDQKMLHEDPYMQKYEYHAVIQRFDDVIVTLNEGCYTMWDAESGKCLGGFNDRNKWKITVGSLAYIKKHDGFFSDHRNSKP